MLLIKSYNENYRHQWDNYVKTAHDSSLFHLTAWKNAVEMAFRHKSHYIMAVREDSICGILPLFEVKSRLFGHALISVPFGVYGGISAHDSEAFYALKESAETLADLISVDYLELRNNGKAFGRLSQLRQSNEPNRQNRLNSPNGQNSLNGQNGHNRPNGLNDSKWMSKDLYVTFQRKIYDSVDENFTAIPRKQRRMIRQGNKFGLYSEIGRFEYLDPFYSIYAKNVRDLGSPVFPSSFFRSLMELFENSFILSVFLDGKMVAGVLTFVFKDTLMPYYGGGLRKYFKYALNDFMYWELMKYGCENKFKTFDFGRSKKNAGSYHFKRHWDLKYDCYLVNGNKMPDVSPVNPKYKFFINVWKRLPVAVTNRLGPKLARGIP
jgi:FemAB-related protein (PEP-CTERM system-associated)